MFAPHISTHNYSSTSFFILPAYLTTLFSQCLFVTWIVAKKDKKTVCLSSPRSCSAFRESSDTIRMRRVLALAALLHPASAAKPPAQLFLSYYSGVSPSVRVCASLPPRERWNPNALALRPDKAVRAHARTSSSAAAAAPAPADCGHRWPERAGAGVLRPGQDAGRQLRLCRRGQLAVPGPRRQLRHQGPRLCSGEPASRLRRRASAYLKTASHFSAVSAASSLCRTPSKARWRS